MGIGSFLRRAGSVFTRPRLTGRFTPQSAAGPTRGTIDDVTLELNNFDRMIDNMENFGRDVVDTEIETAQRLLSTTRLRFSSPGAQFGVATAFGAAAYTTNATASGIVENFGDRMSPGTRAMISAGGLIGSGVFGLSAATHIGRGVILGRAKNPLTHKTAEIEGIKAKGGLRKTIRQKHAIEAAMGVDGSAINTADQAIQDRAVALIQRFKDVAKGEYKTAAQKLKDNAQDIVGASARKRAADFSFRKMLIGRDYLNKQGNRSFGLVGGIGNMFGSMIGKGTLFGKTDPSMSLIGGAMSGGFLGGLAIGGITGYTARKKGKLGSSGPMQRQRGRSFANISHNATLTSHRMAKR